MTKSSHYVRLPYFLYMVGRNAGARAVQL